MLSFRLLTVVSRLLGGYNVATMCTRTRVLLLPLVTLSTLVVVPCLSVDLPVVVISVSMHAPRRSVRDPPMFRVPSVVAIHQMISVRAGFLVR